MKALISPSELFTYTQVTAWKKEGNNWVPASFGVVIQDCMRVAEVEPDDKVFEVAAPLYWVECPEDCKADLWYYKDGLHKKPEDAPIPEGE
jgi:hypothetical protein